MASLIPGYEYDVFISYRHKDNKGDHWVTAFVNALRTELEGTFKEDVSIYFDENPHDGLLETHQVSKSLEGKLKCLVFIPIISQTYCDIQSFAWQHELCAFNRFVNGDSYGKDIRLKTGNVASRILPVRIHELELQDKLLLENELGGTLRSIDFIYMSAGVNRSLTATDSPDKNLNKIFYRDQINKVANSIKEIITGLKDFGSTPSYTSARTPAPARKYTRIETGKTLRIIAVSLIVALIGGALIFNFADVIGMPHQQQIPLHKLVFPTIMLAIVAIVIRQPIRKMGFTLIQIASISVFSGGLLDVVYTLTASSVPELHTDFLEMNNQQVPHKLVNLEFALIRTLGTALMAVGIGAWVLLHNFVIQGNKAALYAVVAMITLTEGNNSLQMYTLDMPFYIYTLAVIFITWIGAFLWQSGDENMLPKMREG